MSDKKTTPPPASDSLLVMLAPKLSKELDHWLAQRCSWSHQDWLDLLAHLRKHGLGELTFIQEGRDAIGRYLEKRRR